MSDSTKIIDPSAPPKLVAPEIIVIDGPDVGARMRLDGAARIGTAPSNDLRLTDPTVSRLHVEMRVARGGIAVRDAGSTNGTMIDGLRVREVTVGAGATIRIGETTLRVEIGDEPMYVDVSPSSQFGDVIGTSVEMRRIFAVLERVAPTDTTLLLQGETGTGKDLVARAVHAASTRAKGPFVAVDCGAIAENLIESELFGHVRGAFSGATADRRGAFEEAEGGTLFFDEIGELPLSLQPKLLRALESREIRRVGSNSVRRVNVRLIAATNRHLPAAVNAGTFREDLYYRLAVVTVELPPLRARREDVALIARHFYNRFRNNDEKLPAALLANVLGREWRGNVRELRNFIERAVSVGGAMPTSSRAPELPAPESAKPGEARPLSSYVPTHLPLREAREMWDGEFENAYVRGVLERANGNVTRAAELAGVNRRYFQRMMVHAGLRNQEEDDE